MTNVRKAVVQPTGPNIAEELRVVRCYLPDNYTAELNSFGRIVITGSDVAGWTLDDYVIPRLASGLICAKELPVCEICAEIALSFSPNPPGPNEHRFCVLHGGRQRDGAAID